jgi:hypothetical protein
VLEPGEKTEIIEITEDTTVNAKGIGGTSEIQAVFMG